MLEGDPDLAFLEKLQSFNLGRMTHLLQLRLQIENPKV